MTLSVKNVNIDLSQLHFLLNPLLTGFEMLHFTRNNVYLFALIFPSQTRITAKLFIHYLIQRVTSHTDKCPGTKRQPMQRFNKPVLHQAENSTQ